MKPVPAFCADCGRCEPFTELEYRELVEFSRTGMILVGWRSLLLRPADLVCVDRFSCELEEVRRGHRRRDLVDLMIETINKIPRLSDVPPGGFRIV